MNFSKADGPRRAVVALLDFLRPKSILDAPAGYGWLRRSLTFDSIVDGIDLYQAPSGYRAVRAADLDMGLPSDLGQYDAIVSCEGIEHLANPGLFLKSACEHIVPGGVLIITTPNTWSPGSRLKLLVRGFYPDFPCLIGKIEHGTHMHIMPWSFPSLYVFLKLSGFDMVTLHDVDEPRPKRVYEWIFGAPLWFYCRRRGAKAVTDAERAFWTQAGSMQSIFGRHLVVSATVATPAK